MSTPRVVTGGPRVRFKQGRLVSRQNVEALVEGGATEVFATAGTKVFTSAVAAIASQNPGVASWDRFIQWIYLMKREVCTQVAITAESRARALCPKDSTDLMKAIHGYLSAAGNVVLICSSWYAIFQEFHAPYEHPTTPGTEPHFIENGLLFAVQPQVIMSAAQQSMRYFRDQFMNPNSLGRGDNFDVSQYDGGVNRAFENRAT